MKFIILNFLFMAADIIRAAPASPAPRIIGGEDVEMGVVPYQVSLQICISIFPGFMNHQHFCGGSIISRKWILTAAHCTPPLSIWFISYQAVAGINNLGNKKGEQRIEIVNWMKHPDFEGGANPNDICLAELKFELIFNPRVQPVGFPSPGSQPSGNGNLSGWGSTSNGKDLKLPKELHIIELQIMSNSECNASLIKVRGTSKPLNETSNICTVNPGNHISGCKGDSGGPLAQNGILIGVVSWGLIPCGIKGAPTVYTCVSNFIDFIKSFVQFI